MLYTDLMGRSQWSWLRYKFTIIQQQKTKHNSNLRNHRITRRFFHDHLYFSHQIVCKNNKDYIKSKCTVEYLNKREKISTHCAFYYLPMVYLKSNALSFQRDLRHRHLYNIHVFPPWAIFLWEALISLCCSEVWIWIELNIFIWGCFPTNVKIVKTT